MKSILLTLILCIPVFCFSQYVHIPDNGFKKTLIQKGVDSNNDGEISYSEAEAIDTLRIPDNFSNPNTLSIESLEGIRAFKNLRYLNCSLHENLKSLDLEGLTKLKRLEASLTQISTLDLSVCPELESVHVVHNKLHSINLTGLNKLSIFRCFSNNLTSLDLKETPNLRTLDIRDNNIKELDVSMLPLLYDLDVSKNNLSTLDVSNSIDIVWLYCGGNNLNSLDLSMLHKLNKVTCDGNPLVLLNLKNGKPSRAHRVLSRYTYKHYLKHFCVNEEELEYWQEKVDDLEIDCEVGSHCAIFPERGENIITGFAQFNESKDDCGTDLSHVMSYQKFLVNSGEDEAIFFTDVVGHFNIPLPSGEYKIAPQFDKPENFETNPGSITLDLDVGPSSFQQDFCVSTRLEFANVETSIIPIGVARPGFDASYKIVYKNTGSVVLDGEVSMSLPSDKTSFLESNPSHDELIENNVKWFFKDLLPQERRIIFVDLNINSPMDSPAVNGGDILKFCANVFIPELDLRADYSACLDQDVVNSYDPNDKTCLEGDIINPEMIGDYIHYKIRFENTGTADAVNIVIKDRIDLSKFDINSIRLVDSSHDPTVTIDNGNVLNFIFEEIYLPFDDESNDGYVVFKIKTLPSLEINDVIENTAEIYFDFNFAIVTNTTKTRIGLDHHISLKLSSNRIEERELSVRLMPNPSSSVLHVSSEENIREIIVYSVLGEIVRHITYTEDRKDIDLDVNKLRSGKYFMQVLFDKTQNVSSFIKID